MLAYLDAGTGSMALAAIAGGAAGVGVVVKAGLDKFRRGGRKSSAPVDAPDDDLDGGAVDDEAIETTTDV